MIKFLREKEGYRKKKREEGKERKAGGKGMRKKEEEKGNAKEWGGIFGQKKTV